MVEVGREETLLSQLTTFHIISITADFTLTIISFYPGQGRCPSEICEGRKGGTIRICDWVFCWDASFLLKPILTQFQVHFVPYSRPGNQNFYSVQD